MICLVNQPAARGRQPIVRNGSRSAVSASYHVKDLMTGTGRNDRICRSALAW